MACGPTRCRRRRRRRSTRSSPTAAWPTTRRPLHTPCRGRAGPRSSAACGRTSTGPWTTASSSPTTSGIRRCSRWPSGRNRRSAPRTSATGARSASASSPRIRSMCACRCRTRRTTRRRRRRASRLSPRTMRSTSRCSTSGMSMKRAIPWDSTARCPRTAPPSRPPTRWWVACSLRSMRAPTASARTGWSSSPRTMAARSTSITGATSRSTARCRSSCRATRRPRARCARR